MGKLVRCITSDGLVAASAIDSTDIAARAEQIHKTSAVVTAALGRLLTAASLMGSVLKGADQTMTLRVKGDGPIRHLIAVSDVQGNVRGYPGNPVVELPLNSHGKLDVGGAVGKGTLTVCKDLGLKEPYNGMIELVSGEIAEDIAVYYGISEQIPTVCALGVLVNPDLTVRAAGGYLIQLLPAAGDDTVDRLEQALEGVPAVTQMLEEGMNPGQILRRAMRGFELEVLETTEPGYRCNCDQQRVLRALKSIGPEQLRQLAAQQPQTEVECQFCDRKYVFSDRELLQISKECESIQ